MFGIIHGFQGGPALYIYFLSELEKKLETMQSYHILFRYEKTEPEMLSISQRAIMPPNTLNLI